MELAADDHASREPAGDGARERARGEAGDAVGPIRPPDAEREWSAEIKWWHRSGRAHFVVMASSDGTRPRAIARSATLTWPPSRPEEIGDFAAAAGGLAEALLSAGWLVGEDGPAWYQRRFTWSTEQPASVPPDDPASAAPVRTPPATAAAAWTEALTRCHVEWRAGYRRSRFEVVMRRPGARRGEVIGASPPFRWTFMSPADRRDPAQVAAVSALRAALLERGWEEVRPGRAWYARRFVWSRDADPPPQLRDRPPL